MTASPKQAKLVFSRDPYYTRARMPTINCATCGQARKIRPSEVLARNYCSHKCRAEALRPEKRTGSEKECTVCKTKFYAKKCAETAKFCSHRCQGMASRLPKNVCIVCDTTFQPKCGLGHQPCCSRACGDRYRARFSIQKVCKICQKSFTVRVSRKSAKFCSRTCATRGVPTKKCKFNCKICNVEFAGYPSRPRVYCSQACRDKDPDRRTLLIAMNNKQQVMHQSKLETTGYAFLDKLGVAYLKQQVLADKFCVDAVIPAASLVIQFDGDYWHGHPDRFPVPDKRQQLRKRLDKSQDAYLSKCGYTVFRIWESTMYQHPEQVKTALLPLLTQLQHKQPVRE